MQIRTFTIPVLGGEVLSDEMNAFLRSKKILSVERRFVSDAQGAFWCFCISYLDEREERDRQREKLDYRQVLDEASFQRFSRLRDIRKQLAKSEEVPAYVIFTDEELAAMAKLEQLSMAAIKSIKGIGEKKAEKYGQYFLSISDYEAEKSPGSGDSGS